jgi:hypothetical protein
VGGGPLRLHDHRKGRSANRFNLPLAGFETAVGLVDDISAPAATNHAAIAMAGLQRLKAVADFHGIFLKIKRAPQNGLRCLEFKLRA